MVSLVVSRIAAYLPLRASHTGCDVARFDRIPAVGVTPLSVLQTGVDEAILLPRHTTTAIGVVSRDEVDANGAVAAGAVAPLAWTSSRETVLRGSLLLLTWREGAAMRLVSFGVPSLGAPVTRRSPTFPRNEAVVRSLTIPLEEAEAIVATA